MQLLWKALKFLFSVVLLAYVAGSLFGAYQMWALDLCPNPEDLGQKCLWPRLSGSDPTVDLLVFVSKGARRPLPMLIKENNLVLKAENIRLTKGMEGLTTIPLDPLISSNRNGSVYAHIFLYDAASRAGGPEAIHTNLPNASMATPPGPNVGYGVQPLTKFQKVGKEERQSTGLKGIYSHIRSRMTIMIVGPNQPVLSSSMTQELVWAVDSPNTYRAMMWVDDFTVLNTDYSVISQDKKSPNPTMSIRFAATNMAVMRALRLYQKAQEPLALALTDAEQETVHLLAIKFVEHHLVIGSAMILCLVLLPLWIGCKCLQSSCRTTKAPKKDPTASAAVKGREEKKDD